MGDSMSISQVEQQTTSLMHDGPPLSDHLVRLPGGHWTLWRWFGLRGTGFPASKVLKLAPQVSSEAADKLLQAEAERDQRQRELLDALYAEQQQSPEKEYQAPYRKAQDRIRKGKAPTLPEGSQSQALLESWLAAQQQVEALQGEFARAFEDGIGEMSQALYEAASDPRFQEAVIWQNRQAFHTGIKAFLSKPPGSVARSSQVRQHEELIASYLQRYCTKNDTIGFFGPVGWSRLSPAGPALRVQTGDSFLAARTVFFENWCIDSLAETLDRNKAIRPWARPRRLPFIYVEGTTLYQPLQSPTQLPRAEAVLLRACDQDLTAQQLAADLLRTHPGLFRGESQIYQMLEQFQAVGLIQWSLEVPFRAHPEKALWRLLDAIQPEQLRKPALAALLKLESGRRAVAQAAGNPEQLDQAMGALEESFTRLTKTAATRAAGQNYAARTLVYEDSRRNMDLEVGPELLASLGPPLSLLLDSARWLTFEFAKIYSQTFHDIYRDLVRQTGSTTMDAVRCWDRVRPLITTEAPRIKELVASFRERWANILDLPEGARRVERTTEAIRPLVAEAFAAPRPGWRSACYHAPDIMIAASSVEAIQRGDYQFVMGEVHLGNNTLGGALFVAQHPAPEELFQARARDLPETEVYPITPRDFEGITARTRPELVSPHDVFLAFSYDAFGTPRTRTITIGELVVEELDGRLQLRTRDGSQRFEFVEAFAELLTMHVSDTFKLLSPRPHMPRIMLDRLVVTRESWMLPIGTLAFAHEKDEAARFLAARRWAWAHGFPRFAFIKTPVELKPFYVDFDSPVLINIFAKIMRRTAAEYPPETLITVGEMWPDLNHIWLPDAEGQRYTCELRMVAVDHIARQHQV
jgi:hypothetical protein